MDLKYLPKLGAALGYLLLIMLMLLLFLGRNVASLKLAVLTNNIENFYLHASNLTLSAILVASIGYVCLLSGAKFKLILGIAALFILANLIVEVWVDFMNTPDLTDAYYGILGTLISLVFLYLTHHYGLVVNNIGRKA